MYELVRGQITSWYRNIVDGLGFKLDKMKFIDWTTSTRMIWDKHINKLQKKFKKTK